MTPKEIFNIGFWGGIGYFVARALSILVVHIFSFVLNLVFGFDEEDTTNE